MGRRGKQRKRKIMKKNEDIKEEVKRERKTTTITRA